MNCKQVRQQLVVRQRDELPADILQHLERCSACRDYHQRSEAVRALVSLKRYERPDPGCEQRCRYSVRQALLEEQVQAEKDHVTPWETVTDTAVPILRYAVATVLIGLLAVHIFLPPMSSMQSSLPETAPRMRAASAAPAMVPTNLAMDAEYPAVVPASFVRTASNERPARVQYGPRPSRLVDFTQ